MAYTFKKDQKQTVKKAFEELLVLRRLRAYLDKKEPELVYWLHNTWRNQSRALTYKELREAILRGDVSWDIIAEWQEDYSAFVVEHLHPYWIDAMEEANKRLEGKYPDWYFDPYADGVREWTTQRAASFVTEVSSTQIDGLRAVIQRAAILEDLTVDQLARAIRPMVGLTRPQAVANMRYFEKLMEKGVAEKKAHDLSMRYAARQHRYRGYNIARTELAFSYNQGAHEGVKQAQARGYMGDCVKVWSTADDERVCPICGGLEGTEVAMDEPFNFRTRLAAAEPRVVQAPPAHPSCRCAVMYKEITPPIYHPSMGTT